MESKKLKSIRKHASKTKIAEKAGLPKEIVLLGKIYKIRLTDCRCKRCNDENAGTINHKRGIIELHKNLGRNDKEYVLFHELAHFFAGYYNLENSEMFADAFAKYVKDTIKQLGYIRA